MDIQVSHTGLLEDSVKLIKGQRCSYGWEVKATGKTLLEAIDKVASADMRLRELFPVGSMDKPAPAARA